MFGIIGKAFIEKHASALKDGSLKPAFQSTDGQCVFMQDDAHSAKVVHSVFITADAQNALMIRGEVYNLETLDCEKKSCLAEAIWDLYHSRGITFLNDLNGAYTLAIWEGEAQRFQLIRDKIGILQGFFMEMPDGLIFGSDPKRIHGFTQKPATLHNPAVLKYLLFCYNPGEASFYSGVNRVLPAHLVEFAGGLLKSTRYWDISFEPDNTKSEADWSEAVREALDKAVRIRRTNQETGAFLSGGLDSSSIVSLLHKQGRKDLSTFSFRCRGETFDESHYAKIVSDTFKTNHAVVEYGAEDILKTADMVRIMDEPFCDVGINVATWLLAEFAAGKTQTIFTGDGGDELFAGHPVYMADKMGALFGHIPPFIRTPIFAFGRSLPDSEQKKDWKVKLKRFSESFAYPENLGTQRWRIYYQPNELAALLNPDFLSSTETGDPYADMVRFNEQANGPDALSRSLHADYQSVVQFYLRRMEMTRAFALTPRFAMLDPEITQLCASMPSKYKIRGWDDTKYIEKKAVEPLLPREIVYRKDKLGHSIPLKNWIRDHKQAGSFVMDLVSESAIRNRGFFNPAAVRKMVDEHQKKTRNHSHRIWALAVLELWLRGRGL